MCGRIHMLNNDQFTRAKRWEYTAELMSFHQTFLLCLCVDAPILTCLRHLIAIYISLECGTDGQSGVVAVNWDTVSSVPTSEKEKKNRNRYRANWALAPVAPNSYSLTVDHWSKNGFHMLLTLGSFVNNHEGWWVVLNK
jgi:hypothetical protein